MMVNRYLLVALVVVAGLAVVFAVYREFGKYSIADQVNVRTACVRKCLGLPFGIKIPYGVEAGRVSAIVVDDRVPDKWCDVGVQWHDWMSDGVAVGWYGTDEKVELVITALNKYAKANDRGKFERLISAYVDDLYSLEILSVDSYRDVVNEINAE